MSDSESRTKTCAKTRDSSISSYKRETASVIIILQTNTHERLKREQISTYPILKDRSLKYPIRSRQFLRSPIRREEILADLALVTFTLLYCNAVTSKTPEQ